jgi:hypothetical protein
LFTGAYSRDFGSSDQSPVYFGYGDQLLTLLSENAPDYDQPIQTIGWSTGNMPACDVAERLNITYRDARYQVERVTFLDLGCRNIRDYATNISNLLAHRMPDKTFWIDNYYSAGGRFYSGVLNIEFPTPPAAHATPNQWYFPSWNMALTNAFADFNHGVFGGAYFSVIGPGRNYRLETLNSDYHFGWITKTASFPLKTLQRISPIVSPARLPDLPRPAGPPDGAVIAASNAFFSCAPVENAVRYQIVAGSASNHLDHVLWQGMEPPAQVLDRLPFFRTWWTIRAIDDNGTSATAPPRLVIRDSDSDGLSDETEIRMTRTNPYQADTDGDGRPDGQELLAGGDPLMASDTFRFGVRNISKEQLEFSWFAKSGRSYSLEFSPAGRPFDWRTLEAVATSTNGGFSQHRIVRPEGGQGFFRLAERPE